VVGAPGETSQVSRTPTDIRGLFQLTSFLAAGFEPTKRGENDYLDVPVDYESGLSLPTSFAGVGGGVEVLSGVWQVLKILVSVNLSPRITSSLGLLFTKTWKIPSDAFEAMERTRSERPDVNPSRCVQAPPQRAEHPSEAGWPFRVSQLSPAPRRIRNTA